MRCPACAHENPAGARFCNRCGVRLETICNACGQANPPGSLFCNACGQPPESARRTSRPPDSYTPKHLAEKILSSKAALEGERKQVTVLFADLKGSMELLADRDPEDARKLLDPVLERMMEAVHRYEGTVNQVMGDGIMALFGAPLAHEDHAVRACYAALRMQESVNKYAEDVRREQGATIRIRVGLNSGEVVVRTIGSDLRMDYTAVGQTTHLAARMEQLADPGAILLTTQTLALAEGFVGATPLGPVAVKGLAAPVEVHELTGVGPVRSRLQAASLRGLSRFVGRGAEIEQLGRAVDQARQGRGQVVAIVGGPGVGKSRLTFELTHSPRFDGWLILRAGAVSYGKATSYLPVIDLLKGYFQIDDRDSPRQVRAKVTARLLVLDPDLEGTIPALLGLLDVSGEDVQWQALDPSQRRQRTLDAIKRLLLREARTQPVLVVLEDLHWTDSETQAVLDSLVDSLPPARLLLLVNYRPEYEHRWGSKTAYTQLRLDPLPRESAYELLRGLLGEDGTTEPLKAILIERTEGNPFFLEESIRALIETKALAGERGAYRLAKVLTDIQIPSTVQSILAARIDRLSPGDKQILQTASVIGKDVPLVLLHAIAETSDDALKQSLTRLQAAEFVYETRLAPDPEYTFKHALTHEVTYGTLLQDRRKALHAGIVGAIERFGAERRTEHVEQLAHHALRGELWEQALRYLHQAGAKALARSANREAVSGFEQALTALQHLPQTRAALEQAIDLRFDLRIALVRLGAHDRIRDYLNEAQRMAETLGDALRLGRVFASMGFECWVAAQPMDALRFGQRAKTVADTTGTPTFQATILHNLGLAYHATGNYRTARNLFRQAVERIEGPASSEISGGGFHPINSRAWLASSLAALGEFDQGIVQGKEAIRIGQAIDHQYHLSIAYRCLGTLYIEKGDLDDAISLLERAVALSLEAPVGHGGAPRALGHAYALSGRIEEGLSLLQETVNAVEASSTRYFHTPLVTQLGEAHLLSGRLPDALACAERALSLARQRDERGYEAYALRLLGEIANHRDHPDVDIAGERYAECMTLADELGMRPLVAHCHLGLGKLYVRTGEQPNAEQHLATATTMYREMGMTYWLEQAEVSIRRDA